MPIVLRQIVNVVRLSVVAAAAAFVAVPLSSPASPKDGRPFEIPLPGTRVFAERRKLNYINDPALKDKHPGEFKLFGVPLPKH